MQFVFQLSVDFTSNGRPNQVYHWNLPITTPTDYWPASPPASPVMPSIPFIPSIIGDSVATIDENPSAIVNNPVNIIDVPSSNDFAHGSIDQQSLVPQNSPSVVPPVPALAHDPSYEDIFNTQDQFVAQNLDQEHSLSEILEFQPIKVTTQKPTTTTKLPPKTIMKKPSKKPAKYGSEKPSLAKPTKTPSESNNILGIPQKETYDQKKQWLTIGKEKGMYLYNGKPSHIYIWRPRPRISVSKYKHPMFTHFNY